MKKTVKICDMIVKASGYLAAILCFILMGVVVFGVFTRYILQRPSDWTMEISQYIFCAMTLFATGYALMEGAHVRIDLIRNHMARRIQARMDMVQYPVVLCLCIILIWMGGEEFWSALVQYKKSESVLSLPLWPVWSTIPAGGTAPASGRNQWIFQMSVHPKT